MTAPHQTEFLSLDPRPFPGDDDSGSSPFDTLWTEFARSRPGISPPRTPSRLPIRHARSAENLAIHRTPSTIELRALEHVSEYDSNLMCPICHVPFIDPVVLDCDHTFCADCFAEYRNGGPSTDRSRCPTCRSYHLGGSRKASRLIKNMCNDMRVRCPNVGCESVIARGYAEQHATKECYEQEMACPDLQCTKWTKRKNFVEEQCIHRTHIECDCGATIRLGQGAWIKHKDEECPSTLNLPSQSADCTDKEVQTSLKESCPGTSYGCTDTFSTEDLNTHTKSCPFARLAPHFKKQADLLTSLTEQLKMSKIRNDTLETGLDRLTELVTSTIQPKLDSLSTSYIQNHEQATDHFSDADVEEIERMDLPSIYESPVPVTAPTSRAQRIIERQRTANRASHQISAAQHDRLRDLPFTFTPAELRMDHLHIPDPECIPRITALESHFSTLETRISDLDARSSMSLMNETLRIREELAHINGAMYSTRAQVQWLLNRERIMGQRDALAAGGAGMNVPRGRVGGASGGSQSQASGAAGPSTTASSSTTNASQPQPQRTSGDRNMVSAWSNTAQGQSMGGNLSGAGSASTSPIFGAARPSLRRQSGGSSQERVKL